MGNFYIADTDNQVIRKVSPAGGITTVAGNYSMGAGYSGDSGPATQAQLNWPSGVAVDSSGNLYIADVYNNVIRMVTPDGTISTFAGDHAKGAGYTGDNGPATEAQLSVPGDISIDGGGNLYIADYGNFAIRMVSAASGKISTVAGGTFCPSPWDNCFSGDGGPATAAQMSQPSGIAVDPSGNIFFSDVNNFRIRAVNVSGPPTLTFPNTNAGSTSGEQTVNLTNLGNAQLTVTSMQLPTGFIWGPDTSCNTSASFQIEPGMSCELAIEFAPPGGANYSNPVAINENSLNNPAQVLIPLVGQGEQLTQTITFTPPTSPVPYSTGLTIPLVATGGASGNPVVFSIDPSSTGSGSIVGSTLDVAGGGIFVIDANQAGNAEYAAAPQVQVTVQVAQLQQTITFPAPILVPLAQGSVTLGATASSGLPVTYTILNGAGTISNGNVLSFTGAGAVQLQANQAGNAQYAAAMAVNGTVSISPTMTPASGTPLTGASQTFSWITGPTSHSYSVLVGDQGATSFNVLKSGILATPSITVSNIPLKGKTLHVYLRIYTAWGSSGFDYTYLEATPAPPALTGPAPVGGTLSGSSATFSWSPGAGNTSFRLAVGTQGVGTSNVLQRPLDDKYLRLPDDDSHQRRQPLRPPLLCGAGKHEVDRLPLQGGRHAHATCADQPRTFDQVERLLCDLSLEPRGRANQLICCAWEPQGQAPVTCWRRLGHGHFGRCLKHPHPRRGPVCTALLQGAWGHAVHRLHLHRGRHAHAACANQPRAFDQVERLLGDLSLEPQGGPTELHAAPGNYGRRLQQRAVRRMGHGHFCRCLKHPHHWSEAVCPTLLQVKWEREAHRLCLPGEVAAFREGLPPHPDRVRRPVAHPEVLIDHIAGPELEMEAARRAGEEDAGYLSRVNGRGRDHSVHAQNSENGEDVALRAVPEFTWPLRCSGRWHLLPPQRRRPVAEDPGEENATPQ